MFNSEEIKKSILNGRGGYSTPPNLIFEVMKHVSVEARFIWMYLFSKKDSWLREEFSRNNVCRNLGITRMIVTRSLVELEGFDMLKVNRQKQRWSVEIWPMHLWIRSAIGAQPQNRSISGPVRDKNGRFMRLVRERTGAGPYADRLIAGNRSAYGPHIRSQDLKNLGPNQTPPDPPSERCPNGQDQENPGDKGGPSGTFSPAALARLEADRIHAEATAKFQTDRDSQKSKKKNLVGTMGTANSMPR